MLAHTVCSTDTHTHTHSKLNFYKTFYTEINQLYSCEQQESEKKNGKS